jgi:hypothetical protein
MRSRRVREWRNSQMHVFISLTLSHNFRLLKFDKFTYARIQTDKNGATDLTHGVGVEAVQILHDARNLPLQFELVTVLEVQSRGVDYGKKDPIETGLMYIYRGGVNARGCLDATAHETVKGRALFSSGSGRDVRGVKQETQERSFASTLRTGNLVHTVRQTS